jgi:uncharacterized protein YbaP (TraB family)
MAYFRRWRWAWVAGLVFAALLAALAWDMRPVTARPALWRISMGDRHAWLFGTIHAVPVGARWLSPQIAGAIAESDTLVLEATGLEAERADRRIFETLGRSPGLAPVAARLSAADRPRLAALRKEEPQALHDIDGYESWAAALLIGAAANTGVDSDEAPEAKLEGLFRSKSSPVRGLETIEAQLGLFDGLAQPDQDAMLAQSVEDASDAQGEFESLYRSWAAGDLPALEGQFLRPLARFPGLRTVLIDRRNALWAQHIDKLLRANGKTAFIAVGAGHLLGPGGVQARLARQGWTVVRVQ